MDVVVVPNPTNSNDITTKTPSGYYSLLVGVDFGIVCGAGVGNRIVEIDLKLPTTPSVIKMVSPLVLVANQNGIFHWSIDGDNTAQLVGNALYQSHKLPPLLLPPTSTVEVFFAAFGDSYAYGPQFIFNRYTWSSHEPDGGVAATIPYPTFL